MKVGIYARISTNEKKQDVDRQFDTLKKYCEIKKWDHVLLPPDKESGYKESAERRENFNKLLEMARRGKINCVLVNSLDRFSREVPTKVFRCLDDLVRIHSCRFISLNESIDSNSPMWVVVMAVFAYMAHNYSKVLGRSVKAGIERKKALGEYCGGRPEKKVSIRKIRRLYKKTQSFRKTAEIYNRGRPKKERVSYVTVKKTLDNFYEGVRP